ncbi:unnamed protein product [Aphis gossypii]|uniref:Uncharacterized protein n=1 Tax=Aphis gossypii TaxID=80765 RepID=A0A9P0NEY5_APHGO|nr:unnamed protein product [Aphis gossypii]
MRVITYIGSLVQIIYYLSCKNTITYNILQACVFCINVKPQRKRERWHYGFGGLAENRRCCVTIICKMHYPCFRVNMK